MFQVVFGVTADEVEVVDWLVGWLVDWFIAKMIFYVRK